MLNLNYNINASNLERAKFTEQENEAFRPFQIQYVIVPAGGGAAAGNNSFNSGSDLPKVGIAGNGGVITSGSFCVQPLVSYPITIGKGGKGGIATSQSLAWTGSTGENSAFYNIEAIGGDGGKSQVYITSSTFAGNGLLTSASGANGGTGSQWTYNLPGCLPTPFDPTCHAGDLISSSYYSGGGAGIIVSQSFTSLLSTSFMYLIVGGGGSGQSNNSAGSTIKVGGGGAGAVLSGSFTPLDSTNFSTYLSNGILNYPITVGVGGLGVLNTAGQSGESSSLFGFSAQGGFGGINELGGNSGTGSANSNFTTGFNGGNNGGGGAGARANGANGVETSPGVWAPGDGGIGALWSGSYYAGGNAGQVKTSDITYSGTAGLGVSNAGGGGGCSFTTISGAGQSGSVIIKYDASVLGPYADNIKGGAISYEGAYKVHTFTSSSQLTIQPNLPTLEVEYIVVGGGGGSIVNPNDCNDGKGFGGGGGAAITGSFIIEPIVKTYPISIGLGGESIFQCLAIAAYDGTGSAAFGVLAGGGERANNGNVGGDSGTGSWGLTIPFIGAAGGGGAAEAGYPLIDLGGGLWAGGEGGSGLQWVDGKYYGGGGGGSTKRGTGTTGAQGQTTQQFSYFPGVGSTGTGVSTPARGGRGIVVARYPGTGSKATGGIISYDVSTNYTYHSFTASGNFVLNENTSSLFTSGLPGVGSGNALFSPSGSLTPIPYTGGGAGASYYNQNGVSGSDGFVAIRYEGAPIAEGGNIVVTDYYTYHLYSSSGDFYVIGNETNPNINPCA